MSRDYSLARSMLSILQIVGWALVGLGTIVFLIEVSKESVSDISLAASLLAPFAGFGLVVNAIIGGAIIDIAETNQRMLHQIDFSQQDKKESKPRAINRPESTGISWKLPRF